MDATAAPRGISCGRGNDTASLVDPLWIVRYFSAGALGIGRFCRGILSLEDFDKEQPFSPRFFQERTLPCSSSGRAVSISSFSLASIGATWLSGVRGLEAAPVSRCFAESMETSRGSGICLGEM